MGVRLEECFQKQLMQYHFHASNNAINKVGVSFAYRYWRNIATEPKKANLDEYTSRYIEKLCYQTSTKSDTSSFEAIILNY